MKFTAHQSPPQPAGSLQGMALIGTQKGASLRKEERNDMIKYLAVSHFKENTVVFHTGITIGKCCLKSKKKLIIYDFLHSFYHW